MEGTGSMGSGLLLLDTAPTGDVGSPLALPAPGSLMGLGLGTSMDREGEGLGSQQQAGGPLTRQQEQQQSQQGGAGAQGLLASLPAPAAQFPTSLATPPTFAFEDPKSMLAQ